MDKSSKINRTVSYLSISPVKPINLIPMSTEEVQLLRSFLQREIDVLRAELKTGRQEASVEHREVKEQIAAVRSDIATLSERVSDVEAHEETMEHADEARQEMKNNIRNMVLATNAVFGTILVLVIFLVDHWKS